jgi:tRNA-dihydrouridine synthase B
VKIGNIKIIRGAFLAPMADYTNIAFRTLCKEYGSCLQYTELISCKSIIYKNKKTKKMLSISEKEKPVFLQLFGNEPKDFEKAIKIIEKKYPDFAGYDLNAGCSVPKALKGKYGCYIMDYPELVGKIIRAMKKSTKKPVTIKMRLGLEKENYLEVAKVAEKAGADAICLHARLGKQGYAGKADLSAIKKLKRASKIPIIGNGDVVSVEDYIKMKKETNCDFVMIGRGAIGNAFLFKQIKEFEEKGLEEVSERKKKDFFDEGKRYLELAKDFSLKVNDIRSYFIALANGFNGAKKLRNKFAMSKSINEIENNFDEFFS